MRALSCQSAWWSWSVELLTCVYWTRPATTQGEHLVSLSLFFFLSPMLSLCFCLFLSFPLSFFLTLSPCLSPQYSFLFSFSLFYFLNPPLPFLPVLLPAVLCSLFFLAFFPASLFLLSLLSVFFILYYCGTSLSVLWFKAVHLCSSLLCTWLSTRTSMHTPPLDD